MPWKRRMNGSAASKMSLSSTRYEFVPFRVVTKTLIGRKHIRRMTTVFSNGCRFWLTIIGSKVESRYRQQPWRMTLTDQPKTRTLQVDFKSGRKRYSKDIPITEQQATDPAARAAAISFAQASELGSMVNWRVL